MLLSPDDNFQCGGRFAITAPTSVGRKRARSAPATVMVAVRGGRTIGTNDTRRPKCLLNRRTNLGAGPPSSPLERYACMGTPLSAAQKRPARSLLSILVRDRSVRHRHEKSSNQRVSSHTQRPPGGFRVWSSVCFPYHLLHYKCSIPSGAVTPRAVLFLLSTRRSRCRAPLRAFRKFHLPGSRKSVCDRPMRGLG